MFSEKFLSSLSSIIENNSEGFNYKLIPSTGVINQNYLFTSKLDEKKHVFRFCLKEDGYYENEKNILEFLDSEVEGLAPKLIHFNFSKEDFEYPFLVIEFKEGETVGLNLTDDIFIDVAKILKKLHSIKRDPATASEREKTNLFFIDLVKKSFLETSNTVSDEMGSSLTTLWKEIEEKTKIHMDLFSRLERNVLIHGDVHGGNMLLNKETNELSLIDWEAAQTGHPFHDIASFFCVAPQITPEQETLFFETYGFEKTEENILLLDLFKIRKYGTMIGFFVDIIATMKQNETEEQLLSSKENAGKLQLLATIPYFSSKIQTILSTM